MAALLAAAALVAAVTYSVNYSKVNFTKNTGTPTPTTTVVKAEKEAASLVLDDLRYPGAEVVRLTADSYQLKSFDDVQVVTDWYKAKINDLQMTVKTFIQTNSNGQISNQLLGSNYEKQVKVTINKNSPAVVITVVIAKAAKQE